MLIEQSSIKDQAKRLVYFWVEFHRLPMNQAKEIANNRIDKILEEYDMLNQTDEEFLNERESIKKWANEFKREIEKL